jgi:sec-independent protein translocase protein TatC
MNQTPTIAISEELSPIGTHLELLRKTLISVIATISVGVIVSFYFHKEIFSFITAPLNGAPLIILNPLEGMIATFKMCFWCGLTATSFIWIFFLIRFIAPALKPNERKMIFPILLTQSVFLLAGLGFARILTIPIANEYLKAFNADLGINQWNLSLYLDYTIGLLLANGFAFQLGGLLFTLIQYGVISYQTLIKWRRVNIVTIFIISAILTPPDVLTQLLMAFPLMGLYELAIIVARIRQRDLT